MHTPGPWLVDEDGRFVYSLNKKGSNSFHAAVSPGHTPGYDSEDTQKANASLIAAAPELLAALEEAYRHLEYCGYGDSWERECAMSLGLPRQIERVIAKAKGELK